MHAEDAICCAVPGCDNDLICVSLECSELIEGQPVCRDCMNAMDSEWRIWSVRRRVLTRRQMARRPSALPGISSEDLRAEAKAATDLDPCREMHDSRC